jgi:predicted metal-dependent hydrolase
MSLAEKAFTELYPDSSADMTIEYSGRLKSYGANVSYNKMLNKFHFKLNKKWRNIDEDIRIGLLQELICKIRKDRRRTFYMDLYNSFIKNIHMAIPKNRIDEKLKESFDRINEKYFLGMVEMPNLVFGQNSTSSLGNYDFKTDTITISRIFEKRSDLTDFIMYHEILHKVHKFKAGLKMRYHSAKFRKAERSFEDYAIMERELAKFLRGRRIRRFLGF